MEHNTKGWRKKYLKIKCVVLKEKKKIGHWACGSMYSFLEKKIKKKYFKKMDNEEYRDLFNAGFFSIEEQEFDANKILEDVLCDKEITFNLTYDPKKMMFIAESKYGSAGGYKAKYALSDALETSLERILKDNG